MVARPLDVQTDVPQTNISEILALENATGTEQTDMFQTNVPRSQPWRMLLAQSCRFKGWQGSPRP